MSRHHSDTSPRRKEESHLISTLKITKTAIGWTVPSGADYMKIMLIAGGGAGAPFVGGDPPINGAGGGGGGSYSSKDFCVTPGDSFNVIIGQGGQNGNDGQNSVLEYKSHHKTALGGKAGVGTVGGKGGKGYHSNESGTDGKSNGEGGKTKTWRNLDTLYGSGGRGGVYVSAPLLVPTNRLVPEDVLQQIKNVTTLTIPKGSPRNCHRKPCCDKKEEKECQCIPNIVIPEPSPEGSPGIQGYCEIEFYSKHSSCHDRKCRKELQKIVIKDSNIEYAINPEADTVIVDTSNFEGYLVLPKGLSAGEQLTVKLLHNQGLNANIYIQTEGSFTLSATMPVVNLMFNGYVWVVVDAHDDVNSLYPTTQECKATLIEDFKTLTYGYGGSIATSVDGNIVVTSQFFSVGTGSNSSGALYIYQKHKDCLKLKQTVFAEADKGFAFGTLAISGDGKTIVVLVYNNITSQSEVVIYGSSDECKYTIQTVIPNSFQLNGVDISSDGNTLMVIINNSEVLIYRRNNNIWTLSDTLPTTATMTYGAINADGTVFVVINNATDVMDVFKYQFGSWTMEYSTLLTAGSSVIRPLDISPDGNTIALAQPITNITTIFQRIGNTWSIQQVLPNFLAGSVSFSGDANTLAVTSLLNPSSIANTGLVNIWTRVGNLWTLKTQLQDGTLYPTEYSQALDVALTSSGGFLYVSDFGFPVSGVGSPLIRVYN